MTFLIIWSKSAIRELQKIDRPIAKRIFEAVGKSKKEPYRYVIKLVNSPFYRLRVGDYRVILDIQENKLRILVIKVGHRKKIYQ